MVRAGESSGLLRNMLASLQTMQRNQMRIAGTVRGALMYPCILTVVALAAIVVMTTFVLPKFAAVFKASHAALPTVTLCTLSVSEFLSRHCLAIATALLLTLVALSWILTRPAVRVFTHAWLLRIPLLGHTLQLSYVVRAVQTLGMLIKSGLPLADALVLIRDMMPNLYYQRFFDQLRDHIAEGKALAPDFDRTTLFPPMVAQMIAVGEQTGTLPAVCLEIASFHEEEMHERIKILTSALEPLIIVLLGGFVGVIAVSVILPMFRIGSAMTGHGG